jgi:DNA-binding MarR family transcriptional regulator
LVNVDEVQPAFASSRIDMAKFSLIMFFMIEQRWSYFIDRDLEPDGITVKQWLMSIIIASGFRSPPSIQEVADAMSTTHQNVRQIADSMERRGLMEIYRDPDNRRIIRLKITDKCGALFNSRNESDTKTVLSMFDNLTDDEMKALFGIIARMEKRSDQLYKEAKARRMSPGIGS